MTVATLIATPDPEPFDIHAQPTWIALGIGKLRRNYPDMQVIHIERAVAEEVGYSSDVAYVDFLCAGYKFTACIVKWDMSPVYINEVAS